MSVQKRLEGIKLYFENQIMFEIAGSQIHLLFVPVEDIRIFEELTSPRLHMGDVGNRMAQTDWPTQDYSGMHLNILTLYGKEGL